MEEQVRFWAAGVGPEVGCFGVVANDTGHEGREVCACGCALCLVTNTNGTDVQLLWIAGPLAKEAGQMLGPHLTFPTGLNAEPYERNITRQKRDR